jgi:hypothetical protein
LLCFLFDDFIATGNASREIIDIALAHFALALMVLLTLEMLCEIIEQHLCYIESTVILLFKGYNSGSIKILSTL